MLLKLIRYSTLFLVMCNFPGWILFNISPIYSSLLSYCSYGLMLLYFFISRNWKLNSWMLVFGIIYFIIGSLVNQTYLPESMTYVIIIIKFFVVILAGYAVVKDTTKNELFFFLLLGASSVFLEMFIYYNPIKDYGRYSGFYLNPNSLGFICMMGYGLSFALDKKWRSIGQIAFTLIGFLTFSRTFLLVWLFMNILSIRISIKNIRVLAIGLGLLISLLTYNAFLPKSNPRLEAMSNILQGKSKETKKLEEGGRNETWVRFYPPLFDKPLFGNGYGAFIRYGIGGRIGVHNAYLRIMGEAGIIPMLIILALYLLLLKGSWAVFLNQPHLFLMTFAYTLFLLTNHDYIEYGYILFFSMWLQYNIISVDKNENFLISNTLASNTLASNKSNNHT